MTWMKRNWLLVTLAVVLWSLAFIMGGRAQATAPWQVTVSGAHTLCTTLSPLGEATYCFANDGLWVSLNGAAFTQIGVVAVTGVTSFNGRTGAVIPVTGDYTYTQIAGTPPSAPVTSVNGKTGVVVLTGTTTIQ